MSVPFYLNVGLAISDGGGAFERVSAAPISIGAAVDPYLTASPWVLVEGTAWRMWYVSGTGLVDSRWSCSSPVPHQIRGVARRSPLEPQRIGGD